MPTKEELDLLEEGQPQPTGGGAPHAAAPGLSDQLLQQLIRATQAPPTMPPAPQAMSIPEALAFATLGTMYKSQMSRDLLNQYVLPELQNREAYPERLAEAQAQAQQQRIQNLAGASQVAMQKESVQRAEEARLTQEQEDKKYAAELLQRLREVGSMGSSVIDSLEGTVPKNLLDASRAEFQSYNRNITDALNRYQKRGELPDLRTLDFFAMQGSMINGSLESLRTLSGQMSRTAASGGGGDDMSATILGKVAELRGLRGQATNVVDWLNNNVQKDPGIWNAIKTWARGNAPQMAIDLGAMMGIPSAEVEAEGRGVMGMMSNFLINKLSGAAVSAQEYARLMKTIPSTAKGYTQNMNDIERILQWIDDNLVTLERREVLVDQLVRSGMKQQDAIEQAAENIPSIERAIQRNSDGSYAFPIEAKGIDFSQLEDVRVSSIPSTSGPSFMERAVSLPVIGSSPQDGKPRAEPGSPAWYMQEGFASTMEDAKELSKKMRGKNVYPEGRPKERRRNDRERIIQSWREMTTAPENR